MARQGEVSQARRGAVRLGRARRIEAWQVWNGLARLGEIRLGIAGNARCGTVW
jgi:hypothetical protein